MIITRHPSGTSDWVLWRNPVTVITTNELTEVQSCLHAIQGQVHQGRMALGFVSYEAGRAFDPHMAGKTGDHEIPLLWFAVFTGHESYSPPATRSMVRMRWKPAISQRVYNRSIRAIKQHIAAGDTYQVNYTFPLIADRSLDLPDLFFQLADNQPTPYAMLIETPDFQIASVSPELFFHLDGNTIRVEPMKGTCPRGPHPELDAQAGEALRTSEKNRAENIMIVDMMRNDLGRIASPGTVVVSQLFTVTPWPTLWQMTSSVTAQTTADVPEIFSALFPCASITGAPKIKTMEIIAELEPAPRGVYTGAIGWWLPGRQARFAVAIRTMVRNTRTGDTRYGIGSGIVWDSRPEDEYRECILKARVLDSTTLSFRLLETMRWEKESGYVLLNEHLERLATSAAFFGFILDQHKTATRLKKKAAHYGDHSHRVRLLLRRDGAISIQAAPISQPGHYNDPIHAPVITASLDYQRIDPGSPFLYHKTTRRTLYQRARKRNLEGDDVLLVNTRDELMEFTTGNVVVRFGHDWLTPERSSGLLSGVFRNKLIAEGTIRTARLLLDDVTRADGIFFINSVRGWRKVTLITP